MQRGQRVPGNADMDEVIRAKRQQTAGSSTRAITIRGAREHNLKNIDLEIPARSSYVPSSPIGVRSRFPAMRA